VITSHIVLSILMSVFPFLIVVTAIAAFNGSVKLADEVGRLLLEAWPHEVAGPLATEIHHVLTTPHGGSVHDRRRIRGLFLFEWNREPAH
jgi:membrane protein